MTKIAVLEEERLKLLETVDQIQSDNQRVGGCGRGRSFICELVALCLRTNCIRWNV